MHAKARRCVSVLMTLSLGGLLAACGSFDSASRSVASVITPYKVDVVQGNFVSKEQVAALQPGMSRQQVREILGTPLVTSVFHADRWEYVFTLKRAKVDPQTRKLTVFFNGDQFDRAARSHRGPAGPLPGQEDGRGRTGRRSPGSARQHHGLSAPGCASPLMPARWLRPPRHCRAIKLRRAAILPCARAAFLLMNPGPCAAPL